MTEFQPRRWSVLTAAEARDLFDHYVAAHPGRVAELLDDVGRRGGPVDELDFTRSSLGRLWAWVMETERPPAAAVPQADMLIDEPPWWYAFHAPLGNRIGPRLAALVSPVAAYLAETILRNRPGSTWVIGSDENGADFRQPLLQVASRGQFLPDSVVLVMATQWADGTIASPDRLVEAYDTRAGPDVSPAVPPAAKGGADDLAELEDIDVGPIDGDFDWNAEIWISEAAEGILGAREFERLEGRFAEIADVERIGWEDREHFLLRLRDGADLASVRDSVRTAIREAHQASKTQEPIS